MGEVRDSFTAEELYELRREDLNEFTSEDERMPSPKDVRAEETIVLPEIQTMTGYIRQHYASVLGAGGFQISEGLRISPD